MRCLSCAQENRDGAKFCDACAAPLPSPCLVCGTANRAGARFCNECAAPLGAPEPLPVPLPARPGGPSLHQPPTLEGERRQLTVMFCDLADSTALSQRLDPEDLRTVLRRFQQTCAETITAFGGHVAHYMGDGLLVYFGYPQAQEDDPQRAVRCGLAIMAAVGRLRERLVTEQGISVNVRAGIHTGLVVLGEMGSGERVEPADVVGETPNIAARLQGLAAPDTVIVSAATARLVQGFFHTEALGDRTLKGIARSLMVYRVLGETGAAGRLDVAATLTPLVGRDSEVALLMDRWRQAAAGRMQVVVLSGEAGIGKSRLVRVLRERIADAPHARVELRCSQFHQHSALYPLIDHYQRFLGFTAEDTPAAKVARLEAALIESGQAPAEVLPLFAALLSLPLPERYQMPALSPERLKQKTFEAAIAWLRAAARRQPVLLIVEDLHWIDPSTLEFLSLTIEQVTDAPVLALLTCRPEFVPPWPPEAHLSLTTLTRLDREQAREVVTRVADGKSLPEEVVTQIVARTDGVPLFVEELTRMVLESGLVEERDGRYALTGPLPPLAIPATLHDSLMARLDRLAAVKEVAQLGATLGREFTYELIHAVARLDGSALQTALAQLVEAGLVFQRGVPPTARYVFKHALIQDAAYQSLLRSRRQQLHAQAARVLEAEFPEVAETQPELIAHHCTAAGLVPQAIPYWLRAGQQAGARSANQEAVVHLTRGLQLLDQLPDSEERAREELRLRVPLGYAHVALHGIVSVEAEAAFVRCLELSRAIGEVPELFPAVYGLVYLRLGRAQYAEALELTDTCQRLAGTQADAGLLGLTYFPVAAARFFRGEFRLAREAAARGSALYDEQRDAGLAATYGRDFGVMCLLYQAWAFCLTGYPDAARQVLRDCLALARRLEHKHGLASTLGNVAYGYNFLREGTAALALAEEATDLATAQRFEYWRAQASVMAGWALADLRRTAAGLARLGEGIAAWRAVGSAVCLPSYLARHAEAHRHAGQMQAALATVEEGLQHVARTGERLFEPELYRIRGELQRTDHVAEAEADLLRAVAVAREQEAKLLELRAAVSLARLWRDQGRVSEARRMLGEIYGCFTEGFDIADLEEARALLDALG